MDGRHPQIRWLQRRQSALWALAVAGFGIGDMVTTSVGLQLAGVVEIGPVAAPLIETFGLWAMAAVKAALLAGSYGVWLICPRPHRLGIPLGLALVGSVVTGWNLLIILRASG